MVLEMGLIGIKVMRTLKNVSFWDIAHEKYLNYTPPTPDY